MNPLRVLVVEDNPADVRLLREALKAARVWCELDVVEDGEAALDYLFRRGRFSSVAEPELVLLDLNLPRKNGLEVLAIVKADPTLKRVPIVILTTSENEDDVLRTDALKASCYIRKPPKLDDFIRIVRAIDNFWLTIVRLPPGEVPPAVRP